MSQLKDLYNSLKCMPKDKYERNDDLTKVFYELFRTILKRLSVDLIRKAMIPNQ